MSLTYSSLILNKLNPYTTTYYLYISTFSEISGNWNHMFKILLRLAYSNNSKMNNKVNVAHLCMTWYLFLFIQNSTHSEYHSLACSVLLNTITYWRSSGCVKFLVINRDIRNIFPAFILNSTDAFIFVGRWLIYVRVKLCLFLSGISEIL